MSFFVSLDDKFMEAHQKIADKWVEKTGKKKETLETILYGTATTAGIIASIPTDESSYFISFIWGTMAYSCGKKTINKKKRPKGTILDYVYEPKKKIRGIFSSIFYGISSMSLTLGITNLIDGINTKDNQKTIFGITNIAIGVYITFEKSADYISISKPKDPDNKNKDPVKDWLKRLYDSMTPQPWTNPQGSTYSKI